MPISLQCDCGRDLRLKEELAGKKIRCPQCKVVLVVPEEEFVDAEPEEESFETAVATPENSPPPLPKKKAPWDKGHGNDDDDDKDSYASTPTKDEDDDDDDDDDRPRKKKKKKSSASSSYPTRSSSSRYSNYGSGNNGTAAGSIAVGLLMMLGAAIWFFAGLAAGYIFYYPPVLFVLGIVAIFKGILGRE